MTVCLRYQEVRGDRLTFSCECAGSGCPDEPLADWEREYAHEQYEQARRDRADAIAAPEESA